eukprot:TRINITY_DN12494_c0_g1_i1.p2 TRINITY_DN12494_c0_g1~~TRINITY_DN12494_c0_g1_i1.p2  ORF type:complete len:328 (+),score=19.94 TRINITY_DN12494_c0_g1_i1:4912-5895(+)
MCRQSSLGTAATMADSAKDNVESESSTIMTLEQFGIMSVSGIAWAAMTEFPKALVGVPVDSLRILLQCSPDLPKDIALNFSSIGSLINSIHNGVGLKLLWRGVLAGCIHDLLLRILMPRISVLADRAICWAFGPYRPSRQGKLEKLARKVTMATTAATVSHIIAQPFALAQTYMLLDLGADRQYTSLWSFFSRIVSIHGPGFLWRGSSWIWQRSLAFALVRFSMDPLFVNKPSSTPMAFASAMAAATLPDLFTEPFDALRRRVMIGGFDQSGSAYGSILWRTRCPIHFWNGLPVAILVDLLFSSMSALAHWHSQSEGQTQGELQQVD